MTIVYHNNRSVWWPTWGIDWLDYFKRLPCNTSSWRVPTPYDPTVDF